MYKLKSVLPALTAVIISGMSLVFDVPKLISAASAAQSSAVSAAPKSPASAPR